MPENQFAPVASLPIYKALVFRGELGHYQLLIATEVMKAPTEWANFWYHAKDRSSLDNLLGSQFIIMDNGLIETGKAADPEVTLEAANLVGASCIVLSDALGDYKKTLKLAARDLNVLRKFDFPLMGVVQGQSVEEAQALIDFYADAGVKYLSIPRVMVEYFGTRRWLVEKARWKKLPIHLLGWSENVEDDLQCAAMEGVMGIDSAVPIWRGLMPIAEYMPQMPPRNAQFGKRPEGYWDKNLDNNRVDIDIVTANVRWTRSWIDRYVTAARSAVEA